MSNPGAVDVGHHRRETTAKTELHRKVQQSCIATRCRPLVNDLRNLAERVPRAKMRHEAVPILAVCATQARAPTPDWRRRQLSRLLREIVIMVSQHNLMWSTRLSMVVVNTKAGVCIKMNTWCRRSSRQVVIGSWELKRKRKWLLLRHVVVVRI